VATQPGEEETPEEEFDFDPTTEEEARASLVCYGVLLFKDPKP
jgi:hypothetical protein